MCEITQGKRDALIAKYAHKLEVSTHCFEITGERRDIEFRLMFDA